jgi:hypothetical protein
MDRAFVALYREIVERFARDGFRSFSIHESRVTH